MLILKKRGEWYKVEEEVDDGQVYKVKAVTPAMPSDFMEAGAIYYPKKTDTEEISYEEAETYEKHVVDDSRYRE